MEPGDQGGGYEAGTVWLGLSADEAFHVSRFRVSGSQDDGLVVLQKLVSGDPPADAAADSGVWRDVATAALPSNPVWVHGRSVDESHLVTGATQENQLDVYVGNGSDETLLGSVSGHPSLDTVSDGTLVTSYNDVVDSKTWGGYLNATGVGDALLNATPAQPVVITYTFATEVFLSALAYTQFYAHNANRHSLRGFFVETVDASGAALRIPTDGSLFSATPETTNEWEVFDLGGARKAKQLRLCIAEPPCTAAVTGPTAQLRRTPTASTSTSSSFARQTPP